MLEYYLSLFIRAVFIDNMALAAGSDEAALAAPTPAVALETEPPAANAAPIPTAPVTVTPSAVEDALEHGEAPLLERRALAGNLRVAALEETELPPNHAASVAAA